MLNGVQCYRFSCVFSAAFSVKSTSRQLMNHHDSLLFQRNLTLSCKIKGAVAKETTLACL